MQYWLNYALNDIVMTAEAKLPLHTKNNQIISNNKNWLILVLHLWPPINLHQYKNVVPTWKKKRRYWLEREYMYTQNQDVWTKPFHYYTMLSRSIGPHVVFAIGSYSKGFMQKLLSVHLVKCFIETWCYSIIQELHWHLDI